MPEARRRMQRACAAAWERSGAVGCEHGDHPRRAADEVCREKACPSHATRPTVRGVAEKCFHHVRVPFADAVPSDNAQCVRHVAGRWKRGDIYKEPRDRGSANLHFLGPTSLGPSPLIPEKRKAVTQRHACVRASHHEFLQVKNHVKNQVIPSQSPL